MSIMAKIRVLFPLIAAVVAQLILGCDDASSPGAEAGPGPIVDASPVDVGVEVGIDAEDAEEVADAAGCPARTSGPTMHQGNVGTETWTAAASPHVLPFDTNIDGTLTVEPCAEVLLGAARTLTVRGTLVADGTAAKTIHIGAQDPAKPFVMIRTSNGTLHLSYVTIDGGGDPSNIVPDLTGMLNLQGTDQTMPSQETIFVDHVSLTGSKTNGLVLRDGAGFAPGSNALTVSGSLLYPVSTWSRAAGGLPTGTYTGNGHDEILIPGGGGYEGFAESATLHDRGVPYHVGNSGTFGELRVDPLPGVDTPSTLTIEPGVILRFKKGGSMRVAFFQSENPAKAALIAVGTLDKPIVFTSAEAVPAAGDWLGIWFGDQPLPTDRIDYARVEYAGGLSSSGSNSCPYPSSPRSDGALRIFGAPAGQFVTNTKIANSGYFGFDRGWRADNLTDFLPTNTFEAVAFCLQSYPKDANGACPSPVPCPPPM
jgi:hypothetical protein